MPPCELHVTCSLTKRAAAAAPPSTNVSVRVPVSNRSLFCWHTAQARLAAVANGPALALAKASV
jgi:hypothetical protein